MTALRALLRHLRPTQQPTPTPPDPQWAIRQPAFPARERERPAVFYGAVGERARDTITESELRLLDGNR